MPEGIKQTSYTPDVPKDGNWRDDRRRKEDDDSQDSQNAKGGDEKEPDGKKKTSLGGKGSGSNTQVVAQKEDLEGDFDEEEDKVDIPEVCIDEEEIEENNITQAEGSKESLSLSVAKKTPMIPDIQLVQKSMRQQNDDCFSKEDDTLLAICHAEENDGEEGMKSSKIHLEDSISKEECSLRDLMEQDIKQLDAITGEEVTHSEDGFTQSGKNKRKKKKNDGPAIATR